MEDCYTGLCRTELLCTVGLCLATMYIYGCCGVTVWTGLLETLSMLVTWVLALEIPTLSWDPRQE
jgi:hypothetical protein